MTMTDRTLKEDLLVGGLTDWADAGWVLQAVRPSGLTDSSELRTLAIGLIAELITERLVLAGSIVGGVHVPWTCSPGEAIERITREWLEEWGDEAPTPGAIVWLDSTPSGDEIGRAVLRREG
jgi:hypothetical protein